MDAAARTRAARAALAALAALGILLVAIAPTACHVTPSRPATSKSPDAMARPTTATSSIPARSTPTDVRAAELRGEPAIRVRLLSAVAGIEVSGPAEVRLAPLAREGQERTLRTPVSITRGDAGWTILGPDRVPVLLPRGETPAATDHLRVEAAGPAGGAAPKLLLNGKPYPGWLVLHPVVKVSPGAFDVIEHVGIETYLPGVIARELYSTWALETFKAQAIAARSYALHEREQSIARGELYDVESTEADQAYGGATDHAMAQRAVRETAGQVLTSAGRVLRAYYSSTCGGRSSSARDIWPTTKGFEYNLAGPIQASARDDSCKASPLFRWTVTRDREELTRRLAHYGQQNQFAVRQLRSITRVEAGELNEYGRPRTYRIFDADGKWYPLTAEQFRVACNIAVPASTGPASESPRAPRSAAPAPTTPVTAPLAALPPPGREARVNSGDLEVEIAGKRVTLRGRGFGHGCGMCQYGAEGMARAGKSHRAILEHSYPGAAIERAY